MSDDEQQGIRFIGGPLDGARVVFDGGVWPDEIKVGHSELVHIRMGNEGEGTRTMPERWHHYMIEVENSWLVIAPGDEWKVEAWEPEYVYAFQGSRDD